MIGQFSISDYSGHRHIKNAQFFFNPSTPTQRFCRISSYSIFRDSFAYKWVSVYETCHDCRMSHSPFYQQRKKKFWTSHLKAFEIVRECFTIFLLRLELICQQTCFPIFTRVMSIPKNLKNSWLFLNYGHYL